jgi:hypothetical protein
VALFDLSYHLLHLTSPDDAAMLSQNVYCGMRRVLYVESREGCLGEKRDVCERKKNEKKYGFVVGVEQHI